MARDCHVLAGLYLRPCSTPGLAVELHLDHVALRARKEGILKQGVEAEVCRRKGYWESTRKTTRRRSMGFSGPRNPALTVLDHMLWGGGEGGSGKRMTTSKSSVLIRHFSSPAAD